MRISQGLTAYNLPAKMRTAALFAISASASALFVGAAQVPELDKIEAFLASAANPFSAPTVDVSAVEADTAAYDNTPVVLMHGLGDAGDNPGMQSLAKSVSVRRSLHPVHA